MVRQPITLAQLHAQRFSAELSIPPVLHLGSEIRSLTARERAVSLHPALPDTPMWCYVADNGHQELVNPTLEVESGCPAKVEFGNGLGQSALAVRVSSVHGTDPATDGQVIVSNYPGVGTTEPNFVVETGLRKGDDTMLAERHVPRVLAPHLHGGNTEARSDGWMENLIGPGQSSVFDYSNAQSATQLWYHDHAAHVTRVNVYSGLAGLYLVRDDDDRGVLASLCDQGNGHGHGEGHEHGAGDNVGHGDGDGDGDQLGHNGAAYEIPMLIQDLNLDADYLGHLTGQLVHKVESGAGPMEFFGPVTMVNRSIWPKVTVRRRRYRLRLLNGANARTFSLALIAGGQPVPWTEVATVIGTDGGLRGRPMPAPAELVLAPAERLDVLVDFGSLIHSHVTVVSTAPAPYGGAVAEPSEGEAAPGTEGWSNRLRFPEVLRFDLIGAPVVPRPVPPLSSTFRRIVHEPEDADPGERVVTIPDTGTTGHHQHRYIALVEEQLHASDLGSVLTLRELEPYEPPVSGAPGSASDRLIDLTEFNKADPAHPLRRTYRTAAKLFHDPGTFTPVPGTIEVWKVVNLSPDTHPFHVHLTQCQVLARLSASPEHGTVPDPDALDWLDFDASNPLANPVVVDLDVREGVREEDRCWKDVVRVNPGEMVQLAVPFGRIDPVHDTITDGCFLGRYMYHCHILEHEDHDMMRHFWVTPSAIVDLMPHHARH